MGFFNVILKAQTYMNMLYLFLSFPLGLAYFIFLVTGLSVGIGLAITLVGIPILVLMMFAWRGLGRLEQMMTDGLLDVSIAYNPGKEKMKFFASILSHLKDPFTWKSLVYLILKFPIGLFSFIVFVVFISVSISFVLAPLLLLIVKLANIPVYFGPSLIDSWFLAFPLFVFGFFLLFISLHLFNGLAYLFGRFGRLMLEKK